MTEPLACKHCGSTLTMNALVRPTADGYEYACEGCAIREGGYVPLSSRSLSVIGLSDGGAPSAGSE